MKPNSLVSRSGTAIVLPCLAAVVTAALLLTHGNEPAASTPAPAPQPVRVTVAAVVERDVTVWTEHSGRLEAVQRVEVRARVSGPIQTVHFREGAMVRKGDLLLSIDPAPYAAAVQRELAQVAAARVQLLHAESEAQRAERLDEERAIAQRDLDERRAAAQAAQAQLLAAEASLEDARLNLSWTQVRAPVAGRIGRLEVTTGNIVAAGPAAPVLATIVSVHPIYAAFDADEGVVAPLVQSLGGIAQARPERVPVRAVTGAHSAVGRLDLVDNRVDSRSGTVRLRAVLDNQDGALLPGQFVRLALGAAQPQRVLLVNEIAIGTDQAKRFVIVVGADGKAAWREVTLGGSADGLRIIASGLRAGELVVVGGLQRVRPGTPVVQQVVDMDGAAQATAGSRGQSDRS